MNLFRKTSIFPLVVIALTFSDQRILAQTTEAQTSDAIPNVSLVVDTDSVLNRIDRKIYGQFLEHIYHAADGGLWGELIWNRSFEEPPQWAVEGNWIVNKSVGGHLPKLVFGEADWNDYEFSFEAQRIEGGAAFMMIVRADAEGGFYWFQMGWSGDAHRLMRNHPRSIWENLGPPVEGKIEDGKWHHVRMRCEGPRLRVWVDGQPKPDFVDQKAPILAGRVGIASWEMTGVRYRNIKVKALDGELLYEGLPSPPPPPLARHWQRYGDGVVRWPVEERPRMPFQEGPLNGDYCVRLISTGRDVGIQQSPLFVEQHRQYRGSVWVRGEVAGHIRLYDEEGILDEVTLPKPNWEWKAYPFTLQPNRTAKNVTIQLGVTEPGRVWFDQLSLMSQASQDVGGLRPDLLKAVAEIRPTVIRWPGGGFANGYRWKDAIGAQHERKKFPYSMWNHQDTGAFGTDEFIGMCRRVGAEPLVVLNTGLWRPPEERSAYLQEARDWIEYCNGPATSGWGKVRAENGHPDPYEVKYWEIDNETWGMGIEAYIQTVRDFVPALKQIDPSIKIAVCGAGNLKEEGLEWNRKMIEGCGELFDYLSVHHYELPHRFAEGPYEFEQFVNQTKELIASSRNPEIKVYVSEWNAQSIDWRTGLYAGAVLNGFERSDVVGMTGPALFLRHVNSLGWINGFINHDHRTWFPGPNYVTMRLYSEHFAPLRIALHGDTQGLNLVATRSEDMRKVYVKAVNPHHHAVNVLLTFSGRFDPQSSSLRLIAPDSLSAHNSLDQPSAVQPVSGLVKQMTNTVQLELPRWSVGVATIVGKK